MGLLGLWAQKKAKPRQIDPNVVYDMGTSPFNAEIYQRSQDFIDVNSDMNQDYLSNLTTAAQDNTYVANRLAKSNLVSSGMGNQAGMLNELVQQNTRDANVGVQENFENYMRNQYGTSNQLLNQATANDMAVRDNMVSAYGQNITNENNWMAAMAGNVTKMSDGKSLGKIGAGLGTALGGPVGSAIGGAAGWLLCDANMKENIKPIGKAKTKSGAHVGIYSYNYKGRDKKRTGVIAQNVRKSHPEHVKKGKNGKLYVNIKGLFG